MKKLSKSTEQDKKRATHLANMFATYFCASILECPSFPYLKYLTSIFTSLKEYGASVPAEVAVLEVMSRTDMAADAPVDMDNLDVEAATRFRTCTLYESWCAHMMVLRVERAQKMKDPKEQTDLLNKVLAHPQTAPTLKENVQRILAIIDPGLPLVARLQFLVEGEPTEQAVRFQTCRDWTAPGSVPYLVSQLVGSLAEVRNMKWDEFLQVIEQCTDIGFMKPLCAFLQTKNPVLKESLELVWDRCDRSIQGCPVPRGRLPTLKQACALKLGVQPWLHTDTSTLCVPSNATGVEWDQDFKDIKKCLAVYIKKEKMPDWLEQMKAAAVSAANVPAGAAKLPAHGAAMPALDAAKTLAPDAAKAIAPPN